nr:RusA family crossover junction endodeoxyribonuclease [uncultured Rhodopila sp.]
MPFPVEFLIQDTPLSHQSKNANAKERWKRKVGEAAKARVDALRDFFFLDGRALAATIFYFPSAPMDGDVDNIVKLIVDGMIAVIYPDDRLLERITVQKFEPETDTVLRSLTPTLEQATEMERPVVYIRIDDDLRWRVLP